MNDEAGIPPVAGMRVALFVNSIMMGGVEEHVRQIAAGLCERHAVVNVICPEFTQIDPLANALEGTGAKVLRLGLSLEHGLLASVARLGQLVSLLKSERVQVLHIHLVGYQGGRWAILAAKLARIPATICTVQIAPDRLESLAVRLERKLINPLVNQFIAVSEATRRQLIKWTGLSAMKTTVIPNAVELPRYEHLTATARLEIRRIYGIPPDAPLLGSVARLDPQKGLAYLLAAMPMIRERVPTVHLLLVGDGSLRTSLEAQARELGLDSCVHFAGQQSDVPRYLSALDIFVLPSLFEGLPLSILEAMASGLPVVATGVNGTPEATIDGRTGYLVPPADPEALATALVRLIENPGISADMSREARLRARLFSADALVDRLAELYTRVLSYR